MRPHEAWCRAVNLTEWKLRGAWENCVDDQLRRTLDKWKWGRLSELADAINLSPFEVLKRHTPIRDALRDGLIMVTPFPAPGRWTAGWVKALIRPNLTQPFTASRPFPYRWRREDLEAKITYPLFPDEEGSPFTQATTTLQWFVDKLGDEHPVMIPLRWGNQVLKTY